ncbi:MAG: CocE/NonD family hydrolase [Acidobacteria bacterium]|nr:CocE/NonD family hydrolase [Acidobacteriota bacterium]
MRKRVLLALVAVVATLGSVVGAQATGPSGYEFVTMPDSVKIAVSVKVPDACYDVDVHPDGCPTIFEMSGYDGGGADASDHGTLAGEYNLGQLEDDSRQLTRHFDDEYLGREYAVVHASVRGSGCSGGEFDLFGWQGALDGKFIIDNWIPKQPWSNGDIGIVGHSYSGLTGTLIASTQPEHLRVISVSGLIDDLYRGIVYPGGVSDYGFPLLWTGGIRTAYDVGGGLAPRLVRPARDGYPGQTAECIEAASTKSRTVLNDAIVQGLSDTDNGWYQVRSLINHVKTIKVPVHIVGAYQDEQTGPRGPAHVWEAIETPKRLVLTNGNHDTAGLYAGTNVTRDRIDWLNKYLYDVPFAGGLSDPKVNPDKRVRVYLESKEKGDPNGIIDSTDFPLPETAWRDYYLDAGQSLVDTAPSGGSASYVSGSLRAGWFREFGETAGAPLTTADGPDMLQFAAAISQDTIVAGPIMAYLDLASTAPDTELYVEIIDQAPDGTRAYLQRGLLKASHRAIIPSNSDCVSAAGAHASCNDPGARMYRPYRPHAYSDLLTPGDRYKLLVEVWPLGHVFRAGHHLRVLVTTPPAFDNYYVYVPKRPVGSNTVYFGPDSKITLPVIPAGSATFVKPLGAARSCDDQDALRCVHAGQY